MKHLLKEIEQLLHCRRWCWDVA